MSEFLIQIQKKCKAQWYGRRPGHVADLDLRRSSFLFVFFLFSGAFFGCSTGTLKYEKEYELKSNKEFDEVVQISEPVPASPTPIGGLETSTDGGAQGAGKGDKAGAENAAKKTSDTTGKAGKKEKSAAAAKASGTEKKSAGKSKADAKSGANVKSETPTPSAEQSAGLSPAPSTAKATKSGAKKSDKSSGSISTHEPDLEDPVGFDGRRPIKDPFRVGEEVVHQVHYFKMSAGEMKLKIEPFRFVNGRKCYTMVTELESDTWFSGIYSVKDRVETFMDFEKLVPWVFFLDVKETNQVKSVKSFFDFDTLKASYWEKKFTKRDGEEEKKLQWDILPYSQNVFSAIFYMRLFAWEPGKEYAFRVADDEQNIIFKGKVLRREILKTEIGSFPSIVIKPEFTVKGVFKPVGEILFWLSDDDRKFPLRIESQIKIGTLVSEVTRLKRGGL